MSYDVGQGIANAMAQNRDAATSNEHYFHPEWSIAGGTKGIYVYSAGEGRTRFFAEDPLLPPFRVLDAAGVDLGPLFIKISASHDIPLTLLLACAKAESNLNPMAEHWGDWPDVSFGLMQQTVRYAPIGDHSNTPQNIAYVRDQLFIPIVAMNIAATQLLNHYLGANGPDRELYALIVYNHGSYPASDDPYWTVYAANVVRYKEALSWARTLVK